MDPTPQTTDQDPVEQAARRALLEKLTTDDRTAILALYHADDPVGAAKHFKNLHRGMKIEEARAYVQELVESSPAPTAAEAAAALPPEMEAPPTLEESIQHPIPDGVERPVGGELVELPKRPDLKVAPPAPKEPPKPPEGWCLLRSAVEDRRHALTPVGAAMVSDQVADALGKLEDMQALHKSQKAAMKRAEDDMTTEISKLGQALREKVQVRSTKVAYRVNYQLGTAREVDADTEQVLVERVMSHEERQLPFPTMQPAPAEESRDSEEDGEE